MLRRLASSLGNAAVRQARGGVAPTPALAAQQRSVGGLMVVRGSVTVLDPRVSPSGAPSPSGARRPPRRARARLARPPRDARRVTSRASRQTPLRALAIARARKPSISPRLVSARPLARRPQDDR